MIRFCRVYVPVAILLMAIFYSYYLFSSRNLLHHAKLEDSSLAKLEQQMLSDELRGFASDLIVFANMQEWKNAFGASSSTAIEDIAAEFKTLLETKTAYKKIRLIDLHGKKLLQVYFDHGVVKIASNADLQDNIQRYYIAASASLHKNQIYISPLDLGWQKGKVEQPLAPSMRLITPVFDANGKKRALLVINVRVEAMLQRFMDIYKGFPNRSHLINKQGDWLHNPVMAEAWNFLQPGQHQFRDQFPQAWQQIHEHERGQFINAEGMFTFSSINPVQEAYSALADSLKLHAVSDLNKQMPAWKIIEFRSHAELAAMNGSLGWRIAGYTLLFLLLLVPLIWRMVSNAINREHIEQRLRDSEHKFRHLVEDLPDGVAVVIDATVVYVNKMVVELFRGENVQSIVGKPVVDFVHPESRQMVIHRIQAVMKGGQVAKAAEEHLLAVDGTDIFALITSMPIMFEGKPAVQTVIRDIIEQREAEEALLHKEVAYKQLYAMLRMMCDNMPDMMWAKDLNQRYIFANKALCENLLHAKDTDEPIGQADMFFAQRECALQPGDPEWHTFDKICGDSDTITLASGKTEQFDEFGNVRGKFLFLDVHKAPMFDVNGDVVGVVGSARDVTESRQAEAQLRKLSQAIEQAGESILITNTDAVIEYVNPAFSKITGYDADEVIGKTPAILNSGRQDDAFYQRLWQKITSGETWHGSLVDKRKDGSLYPALMSVAPIVDGSGVITHYVSIQQDMSAHEELEEKFRQAQKMETLGTLVGGIAHDFNNVLAGMLGNLYLVKKQTALDSGVQEKLERVEKAGLRAADMIKQLLAFSRKAESEFSLMPVQPFIKEVLKLARASIPENIALQYDLGSQDYCIRGDGSQIQQMILNLLVNASHALVAQDKPVITVSLRVYEPDDDFLFVHRDIENKPLLCITVGDNGCGISKANLDHVFEPFFTTKAEGKGTGLGLAMVYGSMQNHAGVIDIESDNGAGTRINLYFPLLDSGEVEQEKERVGVISGTGETILLADDNEHVRETMQEVLQEFGYRVLVSENGQQALMLFVDHASEIGLVLLDIIMPVMGGVETAERLRELKPDVPILFLSGYEKGVSLSDKAAIQDIAVLTKPVDLAELSHHIHASMRK